MEQNKNLHVPFKQLPLDAKGLLFIIAMAEMADYRSWPPTPAEIGGDLEQLWDREKLTEADFRDIHRLSALVNQCMAKYAVKKRCRSNRH
jgi:hypothetical protein